MRGNVTLLGLVEGMTGTNSARLVWRSVLLHEIAKEKGGRGEGKKQQIISGKYEKRFSKPIDQLIYFK